MSEPLSPLPAQDSAAPLVDYYKELGLERGASLTEIQQRLATARMEWGRRTVLAGTRGEEARHNVALIDAAEEVFADEDSMLRYTRSLTAVPVVEDETSVDWVRRAWSYYFQKDYGPATVAARKARQHDSDDPAAFVVSAWIELADGESRRAEEYASEAYVLDEQGEDTVDVHEVRGSAFWMSKKYEQAEASFQRALARAPESYKAVIYWRLAATQHCTDKNSEALDNVLNGLTGPDLASAIVDELVDVGRRAVWGQCLATDPEDKRMSVLKGIGVKVRARGTRHKGVEELLRWIDKCLECIRLDERAKNRPSDPWDFPFKLVGGVVVTFIIVLCYQSALTVFAFMATLGAFVFWIFMMRSQKVSLEEYESDVKKGEALHEEIERALSPSSSS